MQITIRYLIAFSLLCLLIQETHEIAHMLTNYLINGCGGVRYFLFWKLCESGNTYKVAATAFSGPVVNFFFLWLGYGLMKKSNSLKQKSYGFTLIMATLPLQRLQAFVFRGSDEITAFKKIILPAEPFKGAALLSGLLLITILLAPPLYRAFNYLKEKNQLATMLAFLILPFTFGLLCQHIVATESVRSFLLSSPVHSGMLSWLSLLDIFLLVLFVPFGKSIGRLFIR